MVYVRVACLLGASDSVTVLHWREGVVYVRM